MVKKQDGLTFHWNHISATRHLIQGELRLERMEVWIVRINKRSLIWAAVLMVYLFADSFTRIRLGEFISLNMIFTILIFFLFLVILPTIRSNVYKALPLSLWLFSLWLFVSLAWSPDLLRGGQQVLVWTLFIMAIILGRWVGQDLKSKQLVFVNIALLWSFMVLVLKNVNYSIAEFQVIGPRPVALALLVGFSLAYANYSLGKSTRKLFSWLIILVALLVSESRMATMGALAAIGVTEALSFRFNKLKTWRHIGYFIGTIIMIVGLISVYEPLKGRLRPLLTNLPEYSQNLLSAEVVMVTSGRSYAWVYLYENAFESPWFGHGAGSSSLYAFYITGNERLAHAHNEYLRVFHDTGIVGLGLLGIGMARLLLRLLKNARRAIQKRDILPVGALGVLTAIFITSFTDNIGFYSFVMIPSGFLIGGALAYSTTYIHQPIVWKAVPRQGMQ